MKISKSMLAILTVITLGISPGLEAKTPSKSGRKAAAEYMKAGSHSKKKNPKTAAVKKSKKSKSTKIAKKSSKGKRGIASVTDTQKKKKANKKLHKKSRTRR